MKYIRISKRKWSGSININEFTATLFKRIGLIKDSQILKMKKISFLIIPLLSIFPAIAQTIDPEKNKLIPDKFIEIPIVILGIYVIATFILKIIKMILDNRLKYKLLEKGVSTDVVKEFLRDNPKDVKHEVLKWTTLFISICFGLIVSSFFRPYGNHTVVIIAFSIALGFLLYYNFFYRSSK